MIFNSTEFDGIEIERKLNPSNSTGLELGEIKGVEFDAFVWKGNPTSEDALLIRAERYAPVHDVQMHGGLQGAYLPQQGVILLDHRLSGVQRRCVLAHEISHARHRDAGCHIDRWTERRADMEAAMLLIDPMEYSYAETVYEGNVIGMARELNVLPWVISAYRERLHDDPTLAML